MKSYPHSITVQKKIREFFRLKGGGGKTGKKKYPRRSKKDPIPIEIARETLHISIFFFFVGEARSLRGNHLVDVREKSRR